MYNKTKYKTLKSYYFLSSRNAKVKCRRWTQFLDILFIFFFFFFWIFSYNKIFFLRSCKYNSIAKFIAQSVTRDGVSSLVTFGDLVWLHNQIWPKHAKCLGLSLVGVSIQSIIFRMVYFCFLFVVSSVLTFFPKRHKQKTQQLTTQIHHHFIHFFLLFLYLILSKFTLKKPNSKHYNMSTYVRKNLKIKNQQKMQTKSPLSMHKDEKVFDFFFHLSLYVLDQS